MDNYPANYAFMDNQIIYIIYLIILLNAFSSGISQLAASYV